MASAYISLFEKPCVSTSKCKGIYNTQKIVEINGSKEVMVVCNVCKKTKSKYQPS